MKIKKIRGKNFSEALAFVRKELGKDAVILSSEDKNGIRPYVEVTAAVDYDLEPVDNEYRGIPKQQGVDAVSRSDAGLPVKPASELIPGEFIELKQEIKSLRQSIETMKNSGFELKLPEERKKMFFFLKERSIKDEFAMRLVQRAGAIEDIETVMSGDINTAMPHDNTAPDSVEILTQAGKRILMLIGPTGVGKTTTVAKLASRAIKQGKKVAIISIDTYKIGAAEQIRIYSRMIGIPLDIVSNTENLKDSIKKFSGRDIILIDTTGQNPGDRGYISGLKDVYTTGLPIETQLLLSTSSDCDFLMDTYRHYKSLPVDYIAFTKTDEAVKLGSIYNLCCLYKKPVAYITTGQRVPGNIEFVDTNQLTNLILRTGSA